MPLENRTRFDQKDLQLIKHGRERVIGSVAAYNSPPFGDSDRDFVELNIYDINDNYIQTVILSSEDWVIQDEAIKVRPGEDLRKFGFQSGDYKVEYNFFRELGGSENSVLIDEDSQIYRGDFEFNSQGKLIAADGSNKKLELIDNKYFIHDISPDGTEVRLAPHKIQNPKYKSEFEQLQSDYSYISSDPARVSQGFDSLNFIHNTTSGSETGSFTSPEDSINIGLTLAPGDVGFTPEMAGSDLLIDDVFYFGDEGDTVINFGADRWLTNKDKFLHSTISTTGKGGTHWWYTPYFNDRHGNTLTVDQSDITEYAAFYKRIYKDAPNHEANDDDMAEAAFSTRGNLPSGVIHTPFLQKNIKNGRILSNPIVPGLRGAKENGIVFTTVIKSMLNVKKLVWTFTNNGRPDTGEFEGNSFTIEGGGENERIVPWDKFHGWFVDFGFGDGQFTEDSINPWIVEYMSSPSAFDELGPSQLVGFTYPGIYDVKLTVTFVYGMRERVIEVDKKKYLQVQPDYNKDDASLGMQESFIAAL